MAVDDVSVVLYGLRSRIYIYKPLGLPLDDMIECFVEIPGVSEALPYTWISIYSFL